MARQNKLTNDIEKIFAISKTIKRYYLDYTKTPKTNMEKEEERE